MGTITTLPAHGIWTMNEPDPVETVMARARRGDREARAALVRRCQDDWYRFCRSMLLDDHAADDAAQETALRVLASLERFAGDSTFRTWSLGIALNVCREARRRDGRLQSDGGDAAMRLLAPDAADDGVESRARLDAMLAALPPRQREAVVLRYFEQLSVEQTAGRMGCATGTVKATVAQALRNLRRMWRSEP